jgi:hypothetical protein
MDLEARHEVGWQFYQNSGKTQTPVVGQFDSGFFRTLSFYGLWAFSLLALKIPPGWLKTLPPIMTLKLAISVGNRRGVPSPA